MKKINMIMAYISDIFLVGMMLLTVADVVGNFFGHPILGAEEVVGFMASLMIAFALPISHQEKSHIGVDLLYMRMSKRGKRINNTIMSFFMALFFFIASWVSFKYAGYIKKVGTVSPTLGIPFYYIIYLIAFSFFILALNVLIDFISFVRGKRYE